MEKLFPSEKLRQMHEKPNKKCICDKCGKSYSNVGNLNVHKKLHDQNYKPPVARCQFCPDLKWNSRTALKDHLKRFHETHDCDLCGKSLANETSLKRHMMTHTGEKPHAGNKCVCDECGKSFSTVGNLNVHKKVHDRNYELPVVRCQLCPDLKWNSRTGLKHHMKRFHENQTHLCAICGKSLATGGSLKYHMMTHTGEKPVVCPVCQKGFMKTDNLKVHMRVHTKERPFVCNFCQKAYAQNCSLRIHIRTVHEKNLHVCIVCSKSFNTKTLLNVHLQTHLDS